MQFEFIEYDDYSRTKRACGLAVLIYICFKAVIIMRSVEHSLGVTAL
jgi:hypothetical protein